METDKMDGMDLDLPFWNFIVGERTGGGVSNPGNTPLNYAV